MSRVKDLPWISFNCPACKRVVRCHPCTVHYYCSCGELLEVHELKWEILQAYKKLQNIDGDGI